jgi:hypothetical protein
MSNASLIKDARAVAISRWKDTLTYKICDRVGACISVLGLILLCCTFVISVSNKAKIDPYPEYIVPAKYIDAGQDLTIMNDNGYLVVKDYMLQETREAKFIPTKRDTSQDYWAIPMIVFSSLITISGLVLGIGVETYKRNKYYDKFMQKWSETKEYPDM